MSMTHAQLDRLDEIAEAVLAGDADALGPVSTGERIYVALAANRADLLPAGYTLVRVGSAARAKKRPHEAAKRSGRGYSVSRRRESVSGFFHWSVSRPSRQARNVRRKYS
jgi:hypothetical protein